MLAKLHKVTGETELYSRWHLTRLKQLPLSQTRFNQNQTKINNKLKDPKTQDLRATAQLGDHRYSTLQRYWNSKTKSPNTVEIVERVTEKSQASLIDCPYFCFFAFCFAT